MKVINHFKDKQACLNGNSGPVTLAFLGDSVTQGCFEIYMVDDVTLQTVFDGEHAIHYYVKQLLAKLYPSVPVNIINAGISGDSAPGGAHRLERDILPHKPDVTIVSFGLNDSMGGLENLSAYEAALTEIFTKLQQSGTEVIF